jgi:hypothetical protein
MSDHSHNYTTGHDTHTWNGIVTNYTGNVYNQKTIAQLILEQEALKQKEAEVSTLDKIKQERQEARERVRIEKAYAAYDKKDFDSKPAGTVLVFSVSFPSKPDTEYRYAAVSYVDEYSGEVRWSTSGSSSPKNSTTEDLVAWLIRHNVPAQGVRTVGG